MAQIEDAALRRGIGVRAAGMGGAYSAIANDASAVFYNPAGLASPGFGYTIGSFDSDEKNHQGSFDLIKLGYLGYGGWAMRDMAGDELAAYAVGFGNRSGWLNWGASYKNLNWKVSGIRDNGWSTDIGFLARITPGFNIALVGQDIMTGKKIIAPASARLGFGYLPFEGRLKLAADFEINPNRTNYGHLGVEANIVQGLAVRGGIDRGDSTAGATLDFGFFSFDYAALFTQSGQTIQRFEAGIRYLPEKQRPFSIVKPKEYALVDISGTIKGGRDEFSLFGGMQSGLDSILAQLRSISKDDSIDGVMIKLGGMGEGGLGGMAVVQELRSELILVKKKGKKIVAYVEGSAVGNEYYLASVADQIIAPPASAIGGFGKSIQIYRLKGLFKKLGIDWQVFSQGKYKNVFDPYSDGLTEEQEEMLKALLADLYRQMLTDVAKDRNLEMAKLKKLGDGMIFTAKEALGLGLIDKIGYYKDAKKIAAEILGDEKEAKIVAPDLIEPGEVFFTQVFGVAVIEIDGELVSGSGGENILFGGRYVGAETVAEYIHKASEDVFVKAIILRINSPGGSAIAAGEIHKAIIEAKKKKKIIIASIGNIGASGGYYIAAPADKIIADPASITGSIGVIGRMPYFSDLLDKIDVTAEVVKEGKHADMFSGIRKMTSDEAQAIENLQAEAYEVFIQAVVDGRGLSTAEVEAAAQGKIYTGSQAKDVKLVDRLGGFSDAIDLAKKEAEIFGDARLIFYHQPSLFFPFGAGVRESLGLNSGVPWKLFGLLYQQKIVSDLEKQ